jgi:hypothetical protein
MERLEPRQLLAADLYISEFLAVNQSVHPDGDGNYSDWVELHNGTDSTVNLSGWHLTDDRDDLSKWPLPAITLDPNEYLVVFASGQEAINYVDAGGNFHTNFRLDGDGGDLLLVEPDGVSFDPLFLDYPEQSIDISYGVSIDQLNDTLIRTSSPLSFRVPSVEDNLTSWTQVAYQDTDFTKQQTVAGSGVLITEVDSSDEKSSVEIQNVSSEVIDTSGWVVAVNDPAMGINGVSSTRWSLPATMAPGQVLYRTDVVDDQYWGADLPWVPDGAGWVMVLDDAGVLQDFVAWGYASSQISTISAQVGSHAGITVAGSWVGDGAPAGTLGDPTGETVSVGPGADLAGATNADSDGIRLNIEPVYVQTLAAGTYSVSDISVAANSNGAGTLRAFLAILTGAGPTYRTIWTSPATTPAVGDSLHRVDYALGTQQFTLDTEAAVYAGVWHDGSAKVRFSNLATITNHDSTPIIPTAPGQTIADFSHPDLNNRTYAYEINVNRPGGPVTSLVRVGNVDDNSPSDFVRQRAHSLGGQNPESSPLFGGVIPTLGGIGMSGGDPQLDDLIESDVTDVLFNSNSSLLTRFEFQSTDLTQYDRLLLRVRYDDGFQAYLDGVPLVARNAPSSLVYNSAATAERSLAEVLEVEEIDISDALSQLTAGEHVLAVQVLNASAVDADLLLQAELVAQVTGIAQFFEDATPGQASTSEGFNRVADTKFSVDRGLYDAPIEVAITTDTPGAMIVYTLDGSPPMVDANDQIVQGARYESPLTIQSTTTLRALAVKSGLVASNVDTQTYVFTEDVARQTRQSTIDAGFPASWGGRGSDYGMDPDVVGPNDLYGGVYAASIAEDLKALPTMSLVLDIDDMFGSSGIYSNVGNRGQAWERPVSVELIYPDGSKGFQIDAGVRTQGGASRSLSLKNSLRLLFKEQYGATKLEYPLFGDGVDQFDTIVLRAHFNDGWGWSGAGGDPLFARDEWHRQTQAAMGSTAVRGIGVHLYINGIYWGIYNPAERPDASFAAQTLGGDKTEWDAMNHNGLVDGTTSAWNTMLSLANAVNSASGESAKWTAYQRLQGRNPDGTDNPVLESYLDVQNYIDYLLLNFYSGNDDWPDRNWYAARQRGQVSEGFQFFAWDSEISMNLSDRTNLNENVIVDANNGPVGVAAAYGSLRNYSEFRLAMADRVHEHFFNGGVFYVDSANPSWDPAHPERNVPAARMVEIAGAVRDAVVAESARWGDQHRGTPYTRNAEWQSSLNSLLTGFFPQRTGIVLNQLRANGFYPTTAAPEYLINAQRQHGGLFPAGASLSIQNSNAATSTVWYTLDGSDPRLPGGAINTARAIQYSGAIALSGQTRIKARVLNGTEWSALSEGFFATDQGGLRVSEVHYNPAGPTAAELLEMPGLDNDDFEFVEVVNTGTSPIELQGIRFVDGIDFDFGTSAITHLPAGGRGVVVRNLEAFSLRYASLIGAITILGQYESNLSNSGELVRVVGALNDTLVEFSYDDGWYGETDGVGYSLTVREGSLPDGDFSRDDAWGPSSRIGGSPGSADAAVPPRAVIVNELLANDAQSGWIELHNTTQEDIDVSYWYLSDSAEELRKYQMAEGTVIAAGGYLLLQERTTFGLTSSDPGKLIGFGLARAGGGLYLTGGSAEGELLGYREQQNYTATESGVAIGLYRKSTGATDFVRLIVPTPGTGNAMPVIGPIVLNEVMYHPADGLREYVELANLTGQPVALGADGWRLGGAIEFEFPGSAVIAAGGYAVVMQVEDGEDEQAAIASFRSHYHLDGATAVYAYAAAVHGSLANDGEKLFLEKASGDLPAGSYLVIDSVNYDDQAPWPLEADGGGASLSRRVEDGYGNDVANWGISTGNGTPGRNNIFVDTTPPTVPTGIVGRVTSINSVALAWDVASDAQSGVASYRVYRDGQVIGSSKVPRFTVELPSSTSGTVRYRVSAVNGDGVESAWSVTSFDVVPTKMDFQQGVNGYSGAKDAEIREGTPNANNGLTDVTLEVDGDDGGTDLAALLKWEAVSLPTGVAILGASITVTVTNPGQDYAVYELRRAWDEGAVTWNSAQSGQAWQVAGAAGTTDRGSQVGTMSGGTGDLQIDLNAAGLAMVQSWIGDPARNHGVLIANSGNATDGADFNSREHGTPTQRPRLTISFLPVTGPGIAGDLNLDNQVNAEDIDLLFMALGAESNDVAFDLDGTGVVDRGDLDYLVRDLLATQYGDANLDGEVDGVDFAVWQSHRFQRGTGWASGDFNGDRVTDGRDFGIWNQNKFSGNQLAERGYVAVPRAAEEAVVAREPVRRIDAERGGLVPISVRDEARMLAKRMRRAGDVSVSGSGYELQQHRRIV